MNVNMEVRLSSSTKMPTNAEALSVGDRNPADGVDAADVQDIETRIADIFNGTISACVQVVDTQLVHWPSASSAARNSAN
ncbi:MAG: hypothetical protein ACLT1W_15830 [Alistipes onderdonkii]